MSADFHDSVENLIHCCIITSLGRLKSTVAAKNCIRRQVTDCEENMSCADHTILFFYSVFSAAFLDSPKLQWL